MNSPPCLMRSHPLAILTYLYRFFYLLIIPLLRGLFAAFSGGLIQWLAGAWVDLIILGLIVVLAVLKWRLFQYNIDEKGVYYTSGILISQKAFIPLGRISAFSTQQPFWLRPLRVQKLRIDTIARGPSKADLTLYLNKKEGERILALRRSPIRKTANGPAESRPRLHELLFLSLFTSNSLLGVVFLATFFSQAGDLLGEHLSELLMRMISELARQLAIGFRPLIALASFLFRLPPIATGVAVVLLLGWLIAFSLNLLQTKNLYVGRSETGIKITGGILVKKEYELLYNDISFIDIRQSLLTRLLRLYSVYLNAVGMGKERSDISAIVPFSSKKRCNEQLALLLPEFQPTTRTLKPNPGAIMKFIILPLWPCLLIPLAAFLGTWLLPMWAAVLRFAGLMLSLPAYWWLGVRLLDFFSSGVSRAGKYFTLSYSEMYYLHTVVFSADKIALINIRQSILQRGDKKCDLVVSTRSEGKNSHHIRNLSWDSCAALFDAADLEPFILPPSLWDKLLDFFHRFFH